MMKPATPKPPTFDSFTLRCLLPELRGALLGGQVQRIRQPEERTVGLKVYSRGETRWLVLSCHAERFRAAMTDEQPSSPTEAPAFCMALRKYLEGGRITKIDQVGADRILRVEVSAALGTFTLLSELMGRNSNTVLLDAENRVLASARRFAAGAGERSVVPGRPYPALPADSRPAIWDAALSEAPGTGEKSREYAGVSPFLGRHLAAAPDFGAALAEVREAAGGQARAHLFVDEDGGPAGAWPLPSHVWPRERQSPVASLAEALEVVARHRASSDTLTTLRREANALLGRERERISRRLADLDEAVERGAHVGQWRIAGELLVANAHAVERGATSVSLPNWYDPEGGSLQVELDPTLGPRENAEAYFQKARKAVAAAERAPAVRAELAAKLEALDAERTAMESAGEEQLRTWVSEHRKLAGPEQRRDAVREYPPGVRIRKFETDEGFTILVGDNATGNDWLTTKVSDPDDIWLHVRAAASAHGVIRTARKPQSVPPSVVRKAAEIVAARSEAKASGVIPVDYTLRRYVRKPRGAAPGRATYTREKTVYVGKDS